VEVTEGGMKEEEETTIRGEKRETDMGKSHL
jgi:hypothetical protein